MRLVKRNANSEKCYSAESALPPIQQEKNSVTISGTVVDSKNNRPVIGATVMLSDSTIRHNYGCRRKYRLTMRPGEYVMNISLVNYDEATIDLSAYDNGIINIGLEEAPKVLEEIVIQDRAERDITTNRIGQVQVSIADIKRAPSILGEADSGEECSNTSGCDNRW